MNIKDNNIEALDNFVFFLTLFRTGLFEIAHGWGEGRDKNLAQLYLHKQDPKDI